MERIYTYLTSDWEKFTITTIEGRKFKINPMDMSIISGWIPTSEIVLHEKEKYLQYTNSGQCVRIN